MNAVNEAADLRFMYAALELAKQAEAESEVPVGAVLVKDNENHCPRLEPTN